MCPQKNRHARQSAWFSLPLSKMRRLMEVGLCGGPTDLLRRHIVRVRADFRISPDTTKGTHPTFDDICQAS